MKRLLFCLLICTIILCSCRVTDPINGDETGVDITADDGTEAPGPIEGYIVSDPPLRSEINDMHIAAVFGRYVDLGNITAAKVNDKVCIFFGDELVSYGEFTELHIAEYEGKWRLFGEKAGVSGMKNLHSISEEGVTSAGYLVFSEINFIDDIIIDDTNAYTWDMEYLFSHELVTVTDILDTETGFVLFGTDKSGHPADVTYNRESSFPWDITLTVEGDIVTAVRKMTVGYGMGNAIFTNKLNINELDSFGEYRIYKTGYSETYDTFVTYFIKDSQAKRYNVSEFVGDFFLGFSDGEPQDMKVHNGRLETITDFAVGSLVRLSDGRYIGIDAYTTDERQFYIIDGNGEIVFKGNGGLEILQVGADFVLAVDGNMLKLFSPELSELCQFGEMKESYSFHSALSGFYDADEKRGYYFVFEDSSDTDGNYNYRSIEYYYIPETGESGLIDNGYSSFAYAKPVLYLYPTEKTYVTVRFAHPERLTTTYPAYEDGWRVEADPDGTLSDLKRQYYALYWEESGGGEYPFNEGFSVPASDSAEFLEDVLKKIGLTDTEANEFIIYWLPIMEANEYNLISFEFTEQRQASSPLIITPKPDSLLRFAMHIKGTSGPVEIPPQEIQSFVRDGFSAVEWGGCVH